MSRTPPPLDGIGPMPDEMCDALRQVCATTGYTEATIAPLSALPRGVQGVAVPLLRRTLLRGDASSNGVGSAAGVLALLFACQDDVGQDAVQQVLGESLTDALITRGWLERSMTDGSLHSNFQFIPLDGLWLIGDQVANGVSAVMPPGPTTGELVGIMPEHVSGRVLDIGCGPGSLALVAARRGAESVTGVDINPRAIQMAEFNARFNGLRNATFRVGDLTEPVRGERFDLVLAQPPFVVQPPDTSPIAFVHGGPTGETITHGVLSALPEVLAPGGRALILAETPSRLSEPPHQRFRPDLGGADIDLVVLTLPGKPADVQALQYATLEAPEGGPEYQAAVARYAKHLEALDIQLLTHVLIVARARDPGALGAGHRFSATLPIARLSVGDGAAVDALMAALHVASVDDDTLAATKLHASPFARWIEEWSGPNPSGEPTRSVRFQHGRFATEIDNLTESAFRLAGLIDAAASVDAAAREYARTSDVDFATARAQTLRFAREALGRGLLEPEPLAISD